MSKVSSNHPQKPSAVSTPNKDSRPADLRSLFYQTTYRPRSPLSQFVEFLWFREGDNLLQSQSRLLPIGSMELVINLHEDRIPLFDRHSRAECGSTNGTMICGVHSEGYIIRIDRKISVMGVHFKPGGTASFLALPARELSNQRMGLDELWQGRAAELRDRLIEAPTTENRFLILEQFLLMVMQSPDRATVLQKHPAVDFALQEFRRSPTPTVSAVTDRIGYSARHFNQLFRDRVGLTPKLFCRVRRLRQVLYLIAGKEQVDWTDIAFTCGYFDQAHLIHDFRSLADCTPTEYLARRGFHPCHVVLPD
ncbi:MAG: helix-turn-helix transcriptional regulator [Cyanosarcina radialis HA8281-LM2]|jgi:AraC-like DNA-binding protein|nr:helix-turn-helix transcriptional regulator [Cyanosarcina radialis HA8281-LM2]